MTIKYAIIHQDTDTHTQLKTPDKTRRLGTHAAAGIFTEGTHVHIPQKMSSENDSCGINAVIH